MEVAGGIGGGAVIGILDSDAGSPDRLSFCILDGAGNQGLGFTPTGDEDKNEG